MTEYNISDKEHLYRKKEPKFCKCRVCHEYFYAGTLAEAHQACQAHTDKEHPDWAQSACYCPDF